MLRIRIIRAVASRVAYHHDSPALSDDEKRGIWYGCACPALGLAQGQAVTAEVLTRVLDGYHPQTHTHLGLRRDPRRRAGWDVCLSVHKNVSVTALCGPPPLRRAVREAYAEAVSTFPAALEALACRSDGGRRPVDTNSLVIAAYTHERSRYDEPHLHTHFLVGNATRDGSTWRGLEPARFFRNNLTLDRAFQREFFRALRARNIPARLDAKGRVVIDAVPADACARLSTARQTIKAAMETPPESLATLHPQAQAAMLNDRMRPKKKPLDQARSFDRMLSAAELRGLLALKPKPAAPPPPPPPTDDVLDAVRRQSSFLSPFPGSRACLTAAITIACRHMLWPLRSCLEAYRMILASPSTRPAPNPPPGRQQIAATNRAHQRLAVANRTARVRADKLTLQRAAQQRVTALRLARNRQAVVAQQQNQTRAVAARQRQQAAQQIQRARAGPGGR